MKLILKRVKVLIFTSLVRANTISDLLAGITLPYNKGNSDNSDRMLKKRTNHYFQKSYYMVLLGFFSPSILEKALHIDD